MKKEYIITGKYSKKWDKAIEYEVCGNGIKFTEQYRKINGKDIVNGRTIVMADGDALTCNLEALTRATGLDVALKKLSEKGHLNINKLVERCNGYGINYKISGVKLQTAYNKHLKEEEAAKRELIKKRRALHKEAHEMMFGNSSKFSDNKDKGLRKMIDLAKSGHIPAFKDLIEYYKSIGKYGIAAKIANYGITKNISSLKVEASLLYCMGADFEDFSDNLGKADIEKAVKYCLEALKAGERMAAIQMYRYIQLGFIPNPSKYYMTILTVTAKSKQKEKKPKQKLDKAIRSYVIKLINATSLLKCKRYALARAAFESVISDGLLMGYRGMIDCYMAEKRWGKAAEKATEGIAAGDKISYHTAAILHEMGADFAKYTDNLSAPDYDNAILNLSKSIELLKFPEPSLKKLQEYIDKGIADAATLPPVVTEKLNIYKTRKVSS